MSDPARTTRLILCQGGAHMCVTSPFRWIAGQRRKFEEIWWAEVRAAATAKC